MSKKLEITLKRSLIGKMKKQRETIKALGLKKINHTVVKDDKPEIRGMIRKVDFMLEVKEL